MPKLTDVLLVKKPGRYTNFNNYKYVPAYKTVLPAELKDTVASRGEKKRGRLLFSKYFLLSPTVTLSLMSVTLSLCQ